jgi:tetratricopeptide (TPR) repeat protein
MAASYGGDLESAEALLAQALRIPHESTSVTGRAYVDYAAGELAIDPAGAVADYTRAIELSRTCGAAFAEGVATVGLASVWTSLGDAAKAADGFLMLLDYWPSAGNQTQLWTTVRNAALLLLDQGRTLAAALMLRAADAADSASAVGGDSGARLTQAHDTVARLLGPSELAAVSQRAAATSTHDLLTILTDELRGLRDRAMGSVLADDSALTAR